MNYRALVVTGMMLAAGAGVLWWQKKAASEPIMWRLEAVERADVQAVVTATGTLEAVRTVEVGTQVSGLVAELLVDFNDPVRAGQVIARIDDSLLRADVASARAAFDVAAAQLAQARLDLARLDGLVPKGAATPEALELARTEVALAEARLRAARVTLDRAETNLGYATIRSPIDGTVVRRDVEPGQTVNAGMSAPTLFLLAGDLTKMQVLAAVDEADIGRVAQDQPVEVRVRTWPDETFPGRVSQVRLQSTTVESVVTYTVVVEVENPAGRLLPGMTADLDFVVGTSPQTLCVAASALRFQPEPEQIAPTAAKAEPETGARKGGKRRGGDDGSRTLWTVGAGGLLSPLPVKTKLVGRTCTEIAGDGVAEGLEVVAGVERSDAASGSGNPFQRAGSGHRPGGF